MCKRLFVEEMNCVRKFVSGLEEEGEKCVVCDEMICILCETRI